jgi:hypothetical protein
MPDPTPRYRVGRKLRRTLYDRDEVFGMVDTPEQAAMIVNALNSPTLPSPSDDKAVKILAEIMWNYGPANIATIVDCRALAEIAIAALNEPGASDG